MSSPSRTPYTAAIAPAAISAAPPAKIEADPAEPRHVQTVWGVGYRFQP